MNATFGSALAHMAGFQRLAWVPSPSPGLRWRAAGEYVRLSRLQRRLTLPGGLLAELARVLIHVPPQRTVGLQQIQATLAAHQLSRWVHPSALCIAKSLRVLQILQAAGICGDNVRFRLGIRRAAEGFCGHAWVECEREPLLEDLFEPDEFEQVWDGAEVLRRATRDEELSGAAGADRADKPGRTLHVLAHLPGDSQPPRSRYRIPGGILVHPLAEDEAVLLDLASGECFGLNGCSYRIWQELAAGGELEGSIRAIATQSGVDACIVRADAQEFVDQLVNAGLVYVQRTAGPRLRAAE